MSLSAMVTPGALEAKSIKPRGAHSAAAPEVTEPTFRQPSKPASTNYKLNEANRMFWAHPFSYLSEINNRAAEQWFWIYK